MTVDKTYRSRPRTTSGQAVISIGGARSTAHSIDRPGTSVVSIPRSQLYYWTPRWQREEAESLAEIRRGEGREFMTATDAVRWLLSEDD